MMIWELLETLPTDGEKTMIKVIIKSTLLGKVDIMGK
jgi:hypothetical protein